MKKILVVVGSFKVGGAERMAITLGEEWLSRGHDVHFAILRPIFEIPNNIPTERIHLMSNREGSSTSLQHIGNLLNIYKLNRRLKVDVVVGLTYFSSFVGCFTLCKRVLGTFDVFPYQFAKKRARVADFVIRWPYVRKIVCPSFGLLDQVIEHKPNFKEKGIAIYNTLDIEGITEKSKEGVEGRFLRFIGNETYIAAMGRFSRQKNFTMLLQAYAESSIKNSYKLVLIGDGPLREDYEAQIKSLGLEDRVLLTGFLNNPFPLLKDADLFVNTSNYESFCMVILEALALDTPVVATNCKSGPAELVEDGINGKLIEVNNSNQLIEVLNDLNDNQDKINNWKRQIDKTIKKFMIESVVSEWDKIL